jgi:hypothetical protein
MGQGKVGSSKSEKVALNKQQGIKKGRRHSDRENKPTGKSANLKLCEV